MPETFWTVAPLLVSTELRTVAALPEVSALLLVPPLALRVLRSIANVPNGEPLSRP